MNIAAEIRSWFQENLSYKLVALMISLLIWLLVLGRGHQTDEINLAVVLEKLPKEMRIVDLSSDVIKVKIKGPPKLIRRFVLQNSVIRLDNELGRAGVHRLTVRTNNLVLPYGLKMVSITPKYLRVEIEKKEAGEK